jgi:integrase
MFDRDHHDKTARCSGCARLQPLRKGYCRLCWNQARALARATGQLHGTATAVHYLDQVGAHHQLFLADLLSSRGAHTTPERRYDRRGAPRKPPPPEASRPRSTWIQPPLFTEVVRDYTRFDPAHTDPANPYLAWARHIAHTLGEARGWRRGVRDDAERALAMVLSTHAEHDIVRYTELFAALRALDLSVERTADVLEHMGVLTDDRPTPFEAWITDKLDDLTPAIRATAEAWLRHLRDGSPRSRPRAIETVWQYANKVHPVLLTWSASVDHLREITSDHVTAALGTWNGGERQHVLIALRSLFAFAKKNGAVFRNPTAGMKVGDRVGLLPQPQPPHRIEATAAAADTPAERLILILAALHAARAGQIRALRLDDVDLGNRRLTIAGRTRPMDELTHTALLDYLAYRRSRWPDTVNPHLIINQMSAVKATPVSTLPFRRTLRGRDAATLEQLRVDRQLDEALTFRADPLHLAALFGLDEKTAIRYATAARALLRSGAENSPPGRG